MTATTGAWKGALIGLANTIVVGFGLAISERDAGVLPLVLIFGALPGVTLGVGLGMFAGGYAKLAVWARLLIMIVPALFLVSWLAEEFRMMDYGGVAMIPTLVAASVLERWTRWREAPPLPQAKLA